jgi:hypothetical protein
MIRVEEMPAPHLINALLKALAAAEPRSIIDPLTRELVRRGLEDAALTRGIAEDGKMTAMKTKTVLECWNIARSKPRPISER